MGPGGNPLVVVQGAKPLHAGGPRPQAERAGQDETEGKIVPQAKPKSSQSPSLNHRAAICEADAFAQLKGEGYWRSN